ncbi:hypothetical protein MED222_06440 [Vibrio sp. MED222]|nr:hypothetical protein MED222_06440 [Vibrio sp. MED222]
MCVTIGVNAPKSSCHCLTNQRHVALVFQKLICLRRYKWRLVATTSVYCAMVRTCYLSWHACLKKSVLTLNH